MSRESRDEGENQPPISSCKIESRIRAANSGHEGVVVCDCLSGNRYHIVDKLTPAGKGKSCCQPIFSIVIESDDG